MSDEQPVPLKKRKVPNPGVSTTGKICIVHYANYTGDTVLRPITQQSFSTIRNSVDIRQKQSKAEWRLDAICSKVPLEFDSEVHACHRWCYRSFTNVSRLVLKNPGDDSSHSSEEQASTATATRVSGRNTGASTSTEGSSSVPLFPRDQCIFCCKGRRKVRGNYENLTTCVTEKAETSIKHAAEDKEDFSMLGKVAGMDMRAREARYHESCRKSYVRDDRRDHHGQAAVNRSEADEQESSRSEHLEAHSEAFKHIVSYVECSILQDGNAERLTMLRDKYLEVVKQHIPQYSSDMFRTYRLKEKLVNHFGEKIKFWRPSRRDTSELVYPADVETGEVVQTAFEATASEKRVLAEAASILRRNIESTNSTMKATPWPPSADFLQFEATQPPSSLIEFLAQLISGKSAEQSTEKTQRLCASFAEDICSATTRGRWNVPKHQLLGLTLHHITGKAEVVTMLHRYGHCTSYTGVLELETAMANQIKLQKSKVPTNISTAGNKVIHLCWDNFDLNEETPSGAGTTHTTHGIAVQEVEQDCTVETNFQVIPKSKVRSFKPPIQAPLPFARKSNSEPSLSLFRSSENAEVVTALTSNITENTEVQSIPNRTGQLWILCRALFNSKMTVPEWSGWLSKTSSQDNSVIPSRIGYMEPIMHPITDYRTVKQCISVSMEVTQQLKQEYTLVTMDLAAAKIAYDLIWEDEDSYKKVIVNLGPFHTMCSYMGALGKMMRGSGFEDIVVEASLCASGSIEQVMSGKHYNRSLRVHQRMLEALERMLLTSFQESSQPDHGTDSISAAESLAAEPSSPNLQQASEDCTAYLAEFEKFKATVREGKAGKTAKFWMQYCDSVWTLMQFQQAVKANNLDLFITSMRKMCGLLFGADHLNYSKYLSMYVSQLRNLQTSHPGAESLIKDCGFSVARSTVPGCRVPVDQTIEQTVNRSAKTTGGIIGFSRNVGAYHRWCLTRHKRATYVEATLQKVNMVDDHMEAHKSTQPASLKRSEHDIKQIVNTFDHFINPFIGSEEHKDQLFCLSSGQPASEEVAEDLLKYVESGEHAASEFIQSRLLSSAVKFRERVKKMSLKNFQAMAVKCNVTSSKKKTVEVKAERNFLGGLLLLSQTQDVNLERIFQYPIGPIPWALATADGALVKTNKAQIMHCLEDLTDTNVTSLPEHAIHMVDGNALLQGLVRLPETFEGLALFVFNSLPASDNVHFVTDTYLESSVKQLERTRRGSSPTYLIGGGKTRLPRDFNAFLRNSDNKRQLTRFLLSQWKLDRYAPQLQHRKVFFVCEQDCCLLHSEDGQTVTATTVPDLVSDHEEADTRIILHCLYSSQHDTGSSAIVVHSPDTDVFVLLLHYSAHISQQLLFYTGSGNNRRILDVHQIANKLDSDLCAALPSFHAFTGCDTTSAFVRKGKKNPFKILNQNQQAVHAFTSLGTWPTTIREDTLTTLENYVCAMYGKPAYISVNRLRYEIFRSRYEVKTHQNTLSIQNGVDISLLPPCRASLNKHCERVNYQSYIWKHAHVANLQMPSPDGCGWKTEVDGKLSVDWIEEALPQHVVDILATDESEDTSRMEAYEYTEEDEIDNVIDAVFDDDDVDDD